MSNKTPILESEVSDYLKQHPDFFSKHLDLLKQLNIPHQSGSAVSLVERQMQVLRRSNKDLKSRFNKLLDVAKQNEKHFDNTRVLLIELLDFQIRCGSLEELLDIFELRFPNTLAANDFRLVLLDHELTQHFSKILELSSSALDKELPKLAALEKSFCGKLDKQHREILFGEQASDVASCALIPLQHKQLQAVLVIGNTDAEHFHKGMGTLFLDHIGEAIAHVLNELLSKQAQQSIAV